MRNNTVIDISKKMDILKNVQLEGFIIQFSFDDLQSVEHAHFGLLSSYY